MRLERVFEGIIILVVSLYILTNKLNDNNLILKLMDAPKNN